MLTTAATSRVLTHKTDLALGRRRATGDMADIGALVTNAQTLCASDAGLAELQTILDANKDGLAERGDACLAALESGALRPDAHALAWIHLLCAVAGPAPPRDAPMHELDPAGEMDIAGIGSQGSDQPPSQSPAPSPAPPAGAIPRSGDVDMTSVERPRALHLTGDDAGGAAGDRFVALASSLCASCPRAHATRDPAKFARVCAELVAVAVAKRRPASAIAPLLRAVTIAAPNSDHLTPQHPCLFRAALEAKMPDAALETLNRRVYEVDPKTTGVAVTDYLRYCLHGGEIYAALGKYEEACDMLEHAVRAPASAVSEIVVECYKRLVLCSLIARDELSRFPRHTASVVQRNLKSACSEYIALADAYKTRNGDVLEAKAAEYRRVWARDGLESLVNKAVKSLAVGNVARLTRTYLTLSLHDIASKAGLAGGAAAAERTIVGMIGTDEIRATVSQADAVVSFHDASGDSFSTSSFSAKLVSCVEEAQEMSERLRRADESVRSDRAFIARQAEASHGSLGGSLRGMRVGGDDYGDA